MAEHEIFFDVGQRIAALRGKLTQAGFAQRVGASRSSVEGWEAGKRLPDGSSLLRMHEAFAADITYLLTGKTGGVAPLLPPDEEALLANYRQANSDGRERIRQISATAANSPKRRGDAGMGQSNSGAGAVQIGGDANEAAINTGTGDTIQVKQSRSLFSIAVGKVDRKK